MFNLLLWNLVVYRILKFTGSLFIYLCLFSPLLFTAYFFVPAFLSPALAWEKQILDDPSFSKGVAVGFGNT